MKVELAERLWIRHKKQLLELVLRLVISLGLKNEC